MDLDFEEEIINFQPDHNYIYETLGNENQQIYPRPQSHLDKAAEAKKYKENYEKTLSQSDQAKLEVITAVQTIAKTKPIGEQPTLADWDTNENIEKEVCAMIQYCGTSSKNDNSLPFEETHTRQTVFNDRNTGVRIARSGNSSMPLFFDESFFKLRPRKSTHDTNKNEDEIKRDLINSTKNNQVLNSQTKAIKNSPNVKREVMPSSYNKSNISIALKNAIAASHKPPKNSTKVDISNSSNSASSSSASRQHKQVDDMNSNNNNGGMNYAKAVKSNNITTATKLNANKFVNSKSVDVLMDNDPSNKYYTPTKSYLSKKTK